jgi:hypothetical protein
VVPVVLIGGTILMVLLTIFFGVITFGELAGAVLSISAGVLGLALLGFLVVSYILAKLIVAYWAGRLILGRALADPANRGHQFAYLALGLFLYEALRAVPVAGWLLSLVAMFLGLGVLFIVWLERRSGPAAAEKVAVAAAD